jgi:hypothetical protein
MTHSYFELEQMMRARHRELLNEAEQMRRAESARRAARHARGLVRRISVPAALAAGLGRALEAAGRRLQGFVSQQVGDVPCTVCGEPLHDSAVAAPRQPRLSQ